MKKVVLTIWVVLYIASPLLTQEYAFQSLTVEDGLSQSSVTCLAQDQKGFLWIGTRDGLNRYNGDEFKVFRKIPFDTNSLQSNVISSLLVDDFNGIYIGTIKGLQRYDLISNQFTSIPLFLNNTALDIRSIYKDRRGIIWVATQNGFFKVVRDSTNAQHHVTSYFHQAEIDSPKRLSVISFFHDSSNNFWVSTTAGLLKIPYPELQRSEIQFELSQAINSEITLSGLQEYQTGEVVAFDKGVIYHYDDTSNSFNPTNWLQGTIPDTRIHVIEKGQLWALSEANLTLITIEGDNDLLTQEITLPSIGLSQSRHQINYILKDKIYEDLYWLATDLGGVVKMYKRKKKFHTVLLKNIPDLDVTNPYLRHIVAEGDHVWVNIGHGIVLHQRSSNTFQFSTAMFLPGTPISSTSVSSVIRSEEGRVYATTARGLSEIEVSPANTVRIKNYPLPETQRMDFNVIIESKSHFIRGGRTGYISVLHKDSFQEVNSFQPILSDSSITKFEVSSLLLDDDSNLWVGSTNGMLIYPNFIAGYDRIPKPMYLQYNPIDTTGLVDNRITSLFQDSKNKIWICTRNGLMTASFSKGIVNLNRIRIPELENQVLYGILENKHKYEFWLSSNHGLYRYNPNTNEVDNYSYHDGLQGNEFNSFSYYQSASGEMFFGGPKGYTSFFPEEILSDTTSPPIWITDLTTTGNHHINILARDTSRPLELGFAHRSFSINFIGLNYKNTDGLNYYYNLEGEASLQGVALGNSQQVNFSQLDPGNYTLEIFSSHRNGLKNEKSDILHFEIKAPFWRMPWFIISTALLVAFLGWLLFYLRYREKLKQLKAIEQVRKNISEDFHDELGSKLSIISMYSEFTKQELKKPNSKAATYLDKVNDTASRLYENTRDLIWALNPQNDSLYDLFLQLKDFGEEMFQDTDIEFHSAGLADHWKNKNLPMRYKRHLLLIFKEGMHNALKHANCKTIRLSIDEKDLKLIIMLQDDGTGFDTGADHKGDGLKNMAHRAEQLHGGLHFISKEEGTRIWVEIPFDILN